MSDPIAVQTLYKVFDEDSGAVLRGLDLTVPSGSVYGLLGRNGAGKTTLLRTLMGLARPTSGSATVFGRDMAEGCPPEKAAVGYIGQGETLPKWARIADLLAFDQEVRPTWNSERLERWLQAESLPKKGRVSTLSVGQRKRFEIELAFAASPSVLLMDEPFAGLDPVSRDEVIAALFEQVASREVTVMLSSHVMGDLERLCDRVGVLAQGKIAFESTMDAIKDDIVVIRGDTPSRSLPCNGREIASRHCGNQHVWVAAGVSSPEIARLDASGFRTQRGNLEELGVELLRCFEESSARKDAA
jgi:ABC-2 type transport system ATP-binding protein